jgi:hypothetical protein
MICSAWKDPLGEKYVPRLECAEVFAVFTVDEENIFSGMEEGLYVGMLVKDFLPIIGD